MICSILNFFFSRATYNYNFSYLMKVDDDTLVNVSLLNLLVDDGGEEDHVWWSLFNHHRSVPSYGKWADLTYSSPSYPTFPAGSGYLMTSEFGSAVFKTTYLLILSRGMHDELLMYMKDCCWYNLYFCMVIVSCIEQF